ncbi:hypothetical protein H257_05687 [Aphanomyces astaci]|uniref:Uncharacterized protein n=1 Tax=Aphanomyces astaci TaxID=112090 RepID=W4GQD8_APHAT|nr:hypothetical protein H257_05687 [Aphanomyces astaci]ETV81068.1 hypothetical protein H257_05687 [Aphanomyces astaci]|eukprot:XP_009828926.1 hypothetical protein H257_05687 [Aphanomyces astaci]
MDIQTFEWPHAIGTQGNLASNCCRLGPYAGIKFNLFEQLQTLANHTRRIVQVDGVRGFRGFRVHVRTRGAIPFEGIQFACYEYGKTYTTTRRWPHNKTHLQTKP